MRKRVSLRQATVLLLTFVFLFLLPLLANHQGLSAHSSTSTSQSRTAFVKSIVADSQKIAKAYGVNPSIIIAQASLESDFGQTLLARRYHNLFGLEASSGQSRVVLLNSSNKQVGYAHFSNHRAAIMAYLMALKEGKLGDKGSYELFVANRNDKKLAELLQEAGFSKRQNYAKDLVTIINTYKLDQYN